MTYGSVSFSMTETAHFRRLVRFLVEACEHADDVGDYELALLVENCRQDLLRFPSHREG